MHELSITQSILDISLRHAQEAHADRINDIHLVIGQLSSYVDDAIQLYWDIISDGTIAVGATLHFRRIPAEMRCQQCGYQYLLNDSPDFVCPACGDYRCEIISGDQLYIDSIDVIVDENHEYETYPDH